MGNSQIKKKYSFCIDLIDDKVLKEWYNAYNKSVFKGQLPSMDVAFSDHLHNCAAITVSHYTMTEMDTLDLSSMRSKIFVSVPCNEKVMESQLRSTLLHEMCHAAVFHIDYALYAHFNEDSHGPCWTKWTKRASAAHPEVDPITPTCDRDVDWVNEFICGCRGDTPNELLLTKSHYTKPDGATCSKCRLPYILLP